MPPFKLPNLKLKSATNKCFTKLFAFLLKNILYNSYYLILNLNIFGAYYHKLIKKSINNTSRNF